MAKVNVRTFTKEDTGGLLDLMKGLAAFEGYIDDFVVTEDDLVTFGLGDAPAFGAFVAETEVGLVGMVVFYRIPWTYDKRPTIIMKELFVSDAARGLGVGRLLLQRVAARALELDCPRLQWTVLSTNLRAKKFYSEAGGKTDPDWESWGLDEAAMTALVD